MDTPTRKPLARIDAAPPESMVVKSVRVLPARWQEFIEAARARRRSDVTAFFRECADIGLDYLPLLERMQSYSGETRNTANWGSS